MAKKTINVRDFGAKGDGVTDDTKAFIRALREFEQRGGSLYIPKGSYRLRPGGNNA